jgi:tetratricopeptide (TPR) repeat protein
LEESIALECKALVLFPARHFLRPVTLNNLASALQTQFQQKGKLSDLEESIAFYREALVLIHASHPLYSGSLNNLAMALLTQFQQKGELDDLDESIALYREALALILPPNPLRSDSLSNLASALLARFERKGELGDLEESIALHRQALVLRPEPHPERSLALNNLALALWTQFQQKGDPGDLEESIALQRKALVLSPAPHPLRPVSLNNLANALQNQFEQKGKLSDLSDLEESIALHREALILKPAPHPLRCSSLSNLAHVLWIQFQMKGEPGDLEEAIALYYEALDLFPTPHPRRFASLCGLAIALWSQFKQKGEICDLEESMLHFSIASQYETASILKQFDTSQLWAQCAISAHHSSALRAYQNTINLLPCLASLDLNLQKRQKALSRARGLASEACAYAIQVGDFDKAVEFLSAGRAVFWAQALQLRTPLDELHSAAPQLADKLRAISRALELASSSYDNFPSLRSDSQQIRDLEKEARRCRVLNEEWNHALVEVRRLKGFEDFLQPKSIYKLQKASSNGPVVMINAASSGCDALIVTQEEVKHVALSDITAEIARSLGSDMQKALSHNEIRSTHQMLEPLFQPVDLREQRKPFLKGHTAEDTFKEVLEKLWSTVAHPVIEALSLKVV